MKRAWMSALCLTLCLLATGARALTAVGLETETVVRDWATNAFFARMETLTGVQVNAQGITDTKKYQQLLDDMLRGEIPADMLLKADLTRQEEIALLNAGAVIDLAPLIDEHMPNLSALLAAHPDWREVLTLDDGRIASLPLLNPTERQVCVWINRAWLDALGVPLPQTVDALTAALEAIRDGDPNGNGKRDEVPADLLGVYEMRWLLPYFGIVADDYHLARDAQGEIVFAPELPGYRAFIALLKDWHDRGLLGAEAFTSVHSTQTLAQKDDKDKTVTSGLIVTPTPYTAVPVENVLDYEALLLPAPDSATCWRDLLGAVWTGCLAITSECPDVAQALRWADALYTEEGALLAYAGVEGEDYGVREDGTWFFITSNLRDINDIRGETIFYTGTAMPGLYPSAFITRVDSEVDRYVFAQSERVRAVSQRVTPPYALSAADQARADELATTLGACVDRGIARFATGELPLTDEAYSAWLDELHAAGSAELTALFAGQ